MWGSSCYHEMWGNLLLKNVGQLVTKEFWRTSEQNRCGSQLPKNKLPWEEVGRFPINVRELVTKECTETLYQRRQGVLVTKKYKKAPQFKKKIECLPLLHGLVYMLG